MRALLCRALRAQPHELPALAWAFAYFFLLLGGYYILRPVRDDMSVLAGAGRLQWLFTATFLTMLALTPLFGWLCRRLPRARLLPAVYLFFAANLVAFWGALEAGLAPRALAPLFFVWLSVFNLFVVSVFWSFMSDLFDAAQAARLYGAIAAGGSCGAIAGPSLTALGAVALGTANLLLISAGCLAAATGCIGMLLRWARAHPRAGEPPADSPIGGPIGAGVRAAFGSPYLLGICGYLLCYTALSTALYFAQVDIVGRAIPDSGERTRLFATLDLAVNSLTLLVQLGVFARLGAAIGIARMLALMPLVSLAGFLWLGAVPTLAVLIAFGVTRRVGEFAISKPAREELFTVVPREQRYKAKNFIDTVVYRGGDALAGWAVGGLRGLGVGLSALSFLAAPLALAWLALGLWLGRRQERLRRAPV
ncbi:MAG TPA: MFS transporter [Burkholderiales bacterium]|nr:MFS transporter [Burkholderiales bacterium]